MQIAEYWLKQGIDGWRLDVPDQIDVEGFWQEFRSRVKKINPEAYIVGEIWDPAEKWLDGTQFDGVMNYQFTEAALAFCGGDRILKEYVESLSFKPYPALTGVEYQEKIETLLNRYHWQINLTQLNLLASHDTSRLLTIAGEDKKTVELATLLLLTFPGAPSIYYGDEVGLAGGLDPDSRRSFPARQNWDQDLLNYHRELIKLRHQYSALRRGNYQVIYSDEYVYIFSRELAQEKMMIAVNIDTNKQEIKLNKLSLNIEQVLWGDQNFSYQQQGETDNLILSLHPRSGMIAQLR